MFCVGECRKVIPVSCQEEVPNRKSMLDPSMLKTAVLMEPKLAHVARLAQGRDARDRNPDATTGPERGRTPIESRRVDHLERPVPQGSSWFLPKLDQLPTFNLALGKTCIMVIAVLDEQYGDCSRR